MTGTRSRRGLAASTVLALALASSMLAPSVAASAHDGLEASTPSDGEVVSSELANVEITFSEGLLEIGDEGVVAIDVVGPDERFYNLGCAAIDGARASTTVALGESGSYLVRWQVASSDTEVTSDTFDFAYEKPEGTESATGSTGSPCPNGVSAAPTPAATAQSYPGYEPTIHAEGDEDSNPVPIFLVGGGVLAVLVLAAIVLVVTTRNSPGRRAASEGADSQ